MKCNLKTMLSIAAAVFVAAVAASFAFEGARSAIVASLPILLVLLCPLSMLLMMKSMHSASQGDHTSAQNKPESATERGAPAEGKPSH
jgi:hypothetical protein